MPHNAETGRHYSGINVLILWAAVIEGGYQSQRWLTYHADYIGSWLAVLREDEKAIFRAASAASKAADDLLGCHGNGDGDMEQGRAA